MRENVWGTSEHRRRRHHRRLRYQGTTDSPTHQTKSRIPHFSVLDIEGIDF